MTPSLLRIFVVSCVLAAVTVSCGGEDGGEVSSTSTIVETETDPGLDADPPEVVLEPSTIEWGTYAYELTEFDTIRAGSYDGVTTVTRTFDTWVLENEYLEVTLLPEFGGRVLSMIYKPTGHEQLYRNPIGVPYQIDTDVFYHNWLMVYGGIFPTFPEPEHGKAWFHPWEFQIVEELDDRITVSMSHTDDEDHPLAPAQYDTGATGLTVTYFVTLEAGRAALDTEVVITNDRDEPVRYEYWTNATFAPGSDPDDTRATAAAEIIAPTDLIEIPSFWSGIRAVEEPAGLIDIFEFDALRRFENWADLGIVYAFPDMRDSNFWGVIDQDVGEGIFRIADNSVTPGLKLWTWGYEQTVEFDQSTGPEEARPYIEMWAGVTRKFFERTEIEANSELRFIETYAPSIGLSNVTHASEDALVDMHRSGDGVVVVVFDLVPGRALSALVVAADTEVGSASLRSMPDAPARWVLDVPTTLLDSELVLVLMDEMGDTVLEAVLPALDD